MKDSVAERTKLQTGSSICKGACCLRPHRWLIMEPLKPKHSGDCALTASVSYVKTLERCISYLPRAFCFCKAPEHCVSHSPRVPKCSAGPLISEDDLFSLIAVLHQPYIYKGKVVRLCGVCHRGAFQVWGGEAWSSGACGIEPGPLEPEMEEQCCVPLSRLGTEMCRF